MQNPNPSEGLKELVIFIMMVVAPTIFDIILHPAYENGSYHYFNYLERARVRTKNDKNYV